MRDDDELSPLLELVQHFHIPANVLVIERRVHFVEQTERARTGEEDTEEQRQCHQCTLAARQQMDALRLLATRTGVNLDVAIQRLIRIFKPQITFATTKKRLEDLLEVVANLAKCRQKELARRGVDLLDCLHQRQLRFREVVALRREEIEALHFLLVLLHGKWIHRAKLLDLLFQCLVLDAQRVGAQIQRLESVQQLGDRLPPLGFKSFADILTTPFELRVTQFRLVQLLGQLRRATAHQIQRVVTRLQCEIGRTQARLGFDQARVELRQRELPFLKLHGQRCDLTSQRSIGVRQLHQLVSQRLESGRRRRLFLQQSRRAVLRDLHARMRLCLRNLRNGAPFACRLEHFIGAAETFSRTDDHRLIAGESGAQFLRLGIVVGGAGLQQRAAFAKFCRQLLRIITLALRARTAALDVRTRVFRTAHLAHRLCRRVCRGGDSRFSSVQRGAHRLRVDCYPRTIRIQPLEVIAQHRQFGSALDRTLCRLTAGQINRAARIDKSAATIKLCDLAEQGTDPVLRRCRRANA